MRGFANRHVSAPLFVKATLNQIPAHREGAVSLSYLSQSERGALCAMVYSFVLARKNIS